MYDLLINLIVRFNHARKSCRCLDRIYSHNKCCGTCAGTRTTHSTIFFHRAHSISTETATKFCSRSESIKESGCEGRYWHICWCHTLGCNLICRCVSFIWNIDLFFTTSSTPFIQYCTLIINIFHTSLCYVARIRSTSIQFSVFDGEGRSSSIFFLVREGHKNFDLEKFSFPSSKISLLNKIKNRRTALMFSLSIAFVIFIETGMTV